MNSSSLGESTVLLAVDDRQDNLFVLEQLIAEGMPDCNVVTATSAREGLSIAASTHIDGAIIDVQMPKMDGVEMCRRLKADSTTRDIHVILVTAHEAVAELKTEGLNAGADDFISKPIDNAELVARIKVMLRVKKAEDNLLHMNEHLEGLVKERTRKLMVSEGRIRLLSQAIEQSPVSVVITDTNGNIEYVNNTFEQVSGFSAQEVMGRNPRVLQSGNTPRSSYSELWQTITKGQVWQGEFQNRRKNGELFWEDVLIAPVLGESGAICHYLGFKEEITRQKLQEEKILYQAHFDALTELPNRFLALDRLSQLIIEAGRKREKVAVLFLDLDDFKKINDSLGHEIGDKLLIEAAQRLRGVVSSGGTTGRLGGDEFIVLLSGLVDVAAASPIAENLLNCFRDSFRIEARELMLTASIGIALYPDDGNSSSELLRNADTAMYHSKELGRNTYSYFAEAMNRDVSRRLALEEQMRGALERGEFRLNYQPQVDIGSGTVIGAEALLRWSNPALGDVSPQEFIPAAEQTGLIVPIGRFVLTEALGMTAKWQKLNKRRFTISLNLSPRQFCDPDLVPFIEEAMRQSGVPAETVELEITEGVLMGGHVYIEEALAALGNLGVGIAMDDFGTGYSSLSYLRNYPFDIVKIDREFINDITVDPADRELVNAAIAMAHGLGLVVVAEGVEMEEQLAILASLGCEVAQGYLFSRPLPADEITEMFESEYVL